MVAYFWQYNECSKLQKKYGPMHLLIEYFSMTFILKFKTTSKNFSSFSLGFSTEILSWDALKSQLSAVVCLSPTILHVNNLYLSRTDSNLPWMFVPE